MILIGGAKVCEGRQEGLKTGAIIVVQPSDRVKRFWEGKGPGCDFQLADLLAADGTRFIMGRVRYHHDEKMWNSADKKQILQFAFHPSIPETQIETVVSTILVGTKLFGVTEVHEVATDNCPGDQFHVVLERMKAVSPGWRTSSKEYKK